MNFVNNWQREIALSSGATSAALDLPDGDYVLMISDALGAGATVWEVVLASVVGAAATLTRAQEGTSARTWPAGSAIYCTLTAGQLISLYDALADKADASSLPDEFFENPMTAVGDLIVGSTSGAPVSLPVGEDGQVLQSVGGLPAWVTPGYGADGIWRWKSAPQVGDPGSGKVAVDTDNPALATKLIIDILSDGNVDFSLLFSSLQVGDTVILFDRKSSGTNMRCTITGAPVNGGGYFELPISVISFGGSEPSSNTQVVVLFSVADSSDSGGSMTPAEIKIAYESNDDTNAFTDAEKTKLASLDDAHYKGTFVNLAALEAAHATAAAGDYADVDAGVGDPVLRYIWDDSDDEWVAQAGSADPVTAAQVKVLYESNADTNAYSDAEQAKLAAIEAGAQVNYEAVSQADAEAGTGTSLRSWTVQRVWQAIAAWWAASAMKTKLDGIAAGATENSSDATLLSRANHTGTQLSDTISDLAETTQDSVAAMLIAGSNVTLSYNDADGTLTISASGGGGTNTQVIPIACSDEATALTAGTGKVTFRMPFAFTLSGVRASLTTAQTSGSIFTVDINEGGTSVLSTKLTIDNTEKTSTTAETVAVVSDTVLADDAEITVDIDQIGDGTARGLKVYLIGAPA